MGGDNLKKKDDGRENFTPIQRVIFTQLTMIKIYPELN